MQDGIKNIYILNRTIEKAEKLVDCFQTENGSIYAMPWKNDQVLFKKADLLINTTSLGMAGREDINLKIVPYLQNTAVVYDLVYTPLYTRLLIEAEKKGCQIVTGLGMLVFQAVPGFEKWFGIKPEPDAALLKTLIEE